MIVLDTNVVSEPFHVRADPRVISWLDAQAAETLYLSAITVSELLTGIEILPRGERRTRLGEAVEEAIGVNFAGRILPFDELVARTHAMLSASARSRGETISLPDSQIAATARRQNFAVASRDRRPFEAAGVEVIDPWTA